MNLQVRLAIFNANMTHFKGKYIAPQYIRIRRFFKNSFVHKIINFFTIELLRNDIIRGIYLRRFNRS